MTAANDDPVMAAQVVVQHFLLDLPAPKRIISDDELNTLGGIVPPQQGTFKEIQAYTLNHLVFIDTIREQLSAVTGRFLKRVPGGYELLDQDETVKHVIDKTFSGMKRKLHTGGRRLHNAQPTSASEILRKDKTLDRLAELNSQLQQQETAVENRVRFAQQKRAVKQQPNSPYAQMVPSGQK
jgi:hypothetical protein